MAGLISVDNGTLLVYLHSGVSATISSSFAAPESTTSDGASMDGTGSLLLNCNNSKLYKMVGVSSTINNSFNHGRDGTDISLSPAGNLLVADYIVDKVWVFSGISATVVDSFAVVDTTINGITVDFSGNLISTGHITDRIYIHSGIGATITSSFTANSDEPRGLALDTAGNLLSVSSWTLVRIRTHAGITATITTSFTPPGSAPRGITMDAEGGGC